MIKRNLLLTSIALCLSAHSWADINADKINFVKGLYAQQAKNYYGSGKQITRYHDAVEQYSDTQLSQAYSEARRYDRKMPQDAFDLQCLSGTTQMYGGGQDFDNDVPRTYSTTPDGKVKVRFKQYSIPEADELTVHYTLRQHGRSFRVVDMDIKSVNTKNGQTWHTPSYRNHLKHCVRNLKKEFGLR